MKCRVADKKIRCVQPYLRAAPLLLDCEYENSNSGEST